MVCFRFSFYDWKLILIETSQPIMISVTFDPFSMAGGGMKIGVIRRRPSEVRASI